MPQMTNVGVLNVAAAILKTRRDTEILRDSPMVLEQFIYNLADQLERSNPHFHRARFLRACGVEAKTHMRRATRQA